MLMRLNLRTSRGTVAIFAVLLLVIVSVMAHPWAASASTRYVVYSTDSGARGTFLVTWNSATKATIDWTNDDVKSDGKGSYVLLQLSGCGDDNDTTYFSNHNPLGKGGSETGIAVTPSKCATVHDGISDGVGLVEIRLKVCNGSTSSKCDYDLLDNPLNIYP